MPKNEDGPPVSAEVKRRKFNEKSAVNIYQIKNLQKFLKCLIIQL